VLAAAAYLLIFGNIAFWVVLIWHARANVLPTEFVLFGAAAVFFAMLVLSVALPPDWHVPMDNTARASGLALGLAFSAHTVYALRRRVDGTNAADAVWEAHRARLRAKIEAYMALLQSETDEARRQQMLWQIRALEAAIDELGDA